MTTRLQVRGFRSRGGVECP